MTRRSCPTRARAESSPVSPSRVRRCARISIRTRRCTTSQPPMRTSSAAAEAPGWCRRSARGARQVPARRQVGRAGSKTGELTPHLRHNVVLGPSASLVRLEELVERQRARPFSLARLGPERCPDPGGPVDPARKAALAGDSRALAGHLLVVEAAGRRSQQHLTASRSEPSASRRAAARRRV